MEAGTLKETVNGGTKLINLNADVYGLNANMAITSCSIRRRSRRSAPPKRKSVSRMDEEQWKDV